MSLKAMRLSMVVEAATEFREAQVNMYEKRDAFIDALAAAIDTGATQEQIAELCPSLEDPNRHISRQRIGQFLQERK